MNNRLRLCVGLGVWLAAASGAAAQSPGNTLALDPFTPIREIAGGLEVSVDPAAAGQLRQASRVELGPLILPSIAGERTLSLQRADDFLRTGAVLSVNGQEVAPLGQHSQFSAWTGTLSGAPTSHAYLAFSEGGCWGWVRTEHEWIHLFSGGPRAGGTAYWLPDEKAVRSEPPPRMECDLDTLLPLGGRKSNQTSGASGSGGGLFSTLPLYDADVVVETDYQYYSQWGSLESAEGYALALLGAVSDRYREQVGLIVFIPYLGLHSNQNDGWNSQDQGGSASALLWEFQSAWSNGGAPFPGDLYHFLSGAHFGGVAFLDTLCDRTYGFGVSGSMTRFGIVDFPVEQGPANWDFYVIAHELGHNVGSPHTHDYCPPLDECAPSNLYGQCQNQQVCIDYGTNMSYCHLCPDGVSNITTYFHPTVVDVLRDKVENSCLVPFEGVIRHDLGYALAGSNGVPSLEVYYQKDPFGGPADLRFTVEHAPVQELALFVLGFDTLYAPFFGGGTLVPTVDLLFPLTTTATGTLDLWTKVDEHYPGGVLAYAQVWFTDALSAHGFAATNGLEFELIRP